MARRTKSRKSGAGYIEVLVATMILVLSILAAMSLFGFSMKLVDKTGDEGMAYNIARRGVEQARQLGFSGVNLPDGTYTRYYEAVQRANDTSYLGEVASPTSTTRFKMVRTVSTDKKNSLGQPADNAIRTVKVEVFYYPSNEKIDETGTLLVRSGV